MITVFITCYLRMPAGIVRVQSPNVDAFLQWKTRFRWNVFPKFVWVGATLATQGSIIGMPVKQLTFVLLQ